MRGRLILAIISTLLEETAIALIFLVGLSELGISIPIIAIVFIMLAWAMIAVFMFNAGSRALEKKPLIGLVTMVGSKGKVVKTLKPGGLIRIHAELWIAKTNGKDIAIGRDVTVVEQNGRILVVIPDD